MKKFHYLLLLTCLPFITSCNNDNNNESEEETQNQRSSLEAYVNLNPDEPIIVDISNDKGESIVLMGTKTQTGHADKLQQMVITIPEEENPTEVFFDENEQVSDMIAPNGVRFKFDWISKDKVALTLVDPNTNEQLNTLIDFTANDVSTKTTNSRSGNIARRTGDAVMSIIPHTTEPPVSELSAVSRSGGGVVGDVYLEQCGAPSTAECWVKVYDYSEMTGSLGRGRFRGSFPCKYVSKGHYQFQLPENYHVHHNVADYCDAINDVISKVCGLNAFTAPGSGAKQFMCLQISAALASGIVSAPVAAGFLVACEVTSTALDAGCALVNGNMELPEGAPNLVDGLCGALREINYTWDTPLLLIPVVNAMPSCIIGTAQIYKADGNLQYMTVKWGGEPGINEFNLKPSAPGRGVSYNAIADLYCLPAGTEITMEIIGTDGYHAKKSQIVDNTITITTILSVPGAETGVKDVCTVTAVTPDHKTVTKKASLVFQ